MLSALRVGRTIPNDLLPNIRHLFFGASTLASIVETIDGNLFPFPLGIWALGIENDDL